MPIKKSAAPDRSECSALEPLLTAFFDGEATAAEAEVARAHLAACSSCEQVWRQWSSARSLFQSVPATPAPASLLARVRLACRAPEKETAALRDTAAERLLEEALTSASRGLDIDPFSPPLRNFFEEVAPPADLQTKILAATVGVRKPVEVPVVTQPPAWLSSLRDMVSPRSLRWAGAFAAPALACWLILVANTTPPAKTPVVVAEDTPVAHSTPETTPEDSGADSSEDGDTDISGGSAHIASTSPVIKVPHVAAIRGLDVYRTPYAARMTATGWDGDHVAQPTLLGILPHVEELPVASGGMDSEVAHRRPSRRLSISGHGVSTVRNGMRGALVTTTADDELSHAVLATAPEGNIRVAAEDVDETYEAIGKLREARPEDVSKVVDDYRATLVATNERLAADDGADPDDDDDDDELM